MFEEFKENFLNMITSRTFVLILAMILIAATIIHRLFDLQIVNGETYLDSFQTKIMKERTIPGSRGCIYDRNGKRMGIQLSATLRSFWTKTIIMFLPWKEQDCCDFLQMSMDALPLINWKKKKKQPQPRRLLTIFVAGTDFG